MIGRSGPAARHAANWWSSSAASIRAACLLAALGGCGGRPPEVPGPAVSTSDLTSLENSGVAQMGQFDYDSAVGTFEEVLRLKPQSPDTRTDLAIALLNRRHEEDLSRAAQLLDEVIATHPEALRAPFCRALLHMNAGESETAQALFQRVAQADPADAYAIYYVGQCLFAEGDFAGALASYEQARQIDPYLRSAYYGAFQAAQRLGQQDHALRLLDEFQRLGNNPRARLAELKYTRMGPKAEVAVARVQPGAPVPRPTGPVFAEGRVIHRGRRSATVEGSLKDASGKLYAHGTSTCMVITG